MNYAWPAAFAFVGMCIAVAYAVVNGPPAEKSPQIVCFEQHGKWIPSGWGTLNATCEFPTAASK